ncbi:DUF3515 family protein [Kineosporia sp. J2-2]|uniref:DUF3515 family protein n=1 Tax=Kineosporia corallincola TaxID=2835133 RepID=A0ABS5TFE3_9ACTN|nr:DUF3515 family protein [Kineosporia corallincola]MBT0769772.1 DUF3515 family protein [Kineosporia corallincola]
MRRVLRDIGQIRVRPRRRALIAVPVALGAAVVLAACGSGSATGDGEEAAALTPGPDAADAACTDLLDRLPATVLSLARDTGEQPRGIARWGDPAISLSCGATPTGPTTDECIEVDDVSWVFTESDDSYNFLTYGRDPAVLVRVPSSVERSSATGALADLNDAVAELDTTERRCYDVTDTVPGSSATTATN